MSSLESWAFFCMMGSMTLVTLSLTVFTGGWAIAANLIAVVLGILSGGLYAYRLRVGADQLRYWWRREDGDYSRADR
jgi:hypothetical protein